MYCAFHTWYVKKLYICFVFMRVNLFTSYAFWNVNGHCNSWQYRNVREGKLSLLKRYRVTKEHYQYVSMPP